MSAATYLPISPQWLRGEADQAAPVWRQIHEQLWIRGRTASSCNLVLVELRGAIDAQNAAALTRAFDELIDMGATSMCVDVNAVESFDDAGARTFAITANHVEARGGRFRVRNARSSIEQMLHAAGLGRLLLTSRCTRSQTVGDEPSAPPRTGAAERRTRLP
jgi:anti-anti-sigma factor